MVDLFSNLTYVYLVISTSQEDTLAGKSAFERWADIFGIKIKRYHSDYGRFSQQPLISAIDNANHTIVCFEVVSHHKMLLLK